MTLNYFGYCDISQPIRYLSKQGVCNYILATDDCPESYQAAVRDRKRSVDDTSTTGTGTFKVEVQNVPCGAEGMSCSKSVKVCHHRCHVDLIIGPIMYIYMTYITYIV